MIFFDIGATLIDGPNLAPARQLQQLLGLSDLLRKEIDTRLLTGGLSSRLDLVEYLRAETKLGWQPCQDAVEAVWRSQAQEPRAVVGAAELLHALRNQAVPYGFISNIWAPYADAFRRLFGELAEGRSAILSYQRGVAKPDPEIYRQALEAGAHNPTQCVMIGDSYDNDMEPAIALGMRTVWLLHRPAKEKPFLEKVGAGLLASPDLIVPSISSLSPQMLKDITR
mgnify:CR=1 FL=1